MKDHELVNLVDINEQIKAGNTHLLALETAIEKKEAELRAMLKQADRRHGAWERYNHILDSLSEEGQLKFDVPTLATLAFKQVDYFDAVADELEKEQCK